MQEKRNKNTQRRRVAQVNFIKNLFHFRTLARTTQCDIHLYAQIIKKKTKIDKKTQNKPHVQSVRCVCACVCVCGGGGGQSCSASVTKCFKEGRAVKEDDDGSGKSRCKLIRSRRSLTRRHWETVPTAPIVHATRDGSARQTKKKKTKHASADCRTDDGCNDAGRAAASRERLPLREAPQKTLMEN